MFADADIEAAADGISIAGYFNAGQDCTAGTRVIVSRQRSHDTVRRERWSTKARTHPAAGRPRRRGRRLRSAGRRGPASTEVLLDHRGLPEHATVVTGGRQFGDHGFFFEPTVITGLQQDDQAIQEEIFGPVITVQSFTDEADALAKANGVPYGLSSSVWTRDHSTALRMSRDLDFGCVWINTHIPLAAEMPHGGFGSRGTARICRATAWRTTPGSSM